MPQSDIGTWLQFALQQMAAESYLDGSDLITRLTLGNNNPLLNDPNDPTLDGATRFINLAGAPNATQITGSAQAFAARYQIVDHHANDATGFSATLMRDTTTGEYTLSFRSTEYKNQIDGGDYERDGANGLFLTGGADGEILTKGFAFGQLASMEDYYQSTVKNLLPQGAVLNVTGYSLGAHLATVFTELHSLEANTAFTFWHTYTFNGPGRGEFADGQQTETVEADQIRAMITRLTDVLTNPLAGIAPGTPETLWPPSLNAALLAQQQDPTWNPWENGSTLSVYADARYLWAKQVVEEEFSPVSRSLSDIPRTDGAFSLITQIVGHASQGDTEYVANSGNHATETSVYIEDQPNLDGFGGFKGTSGDFGTTHSLTLLVDSLATQELFQTVSPTLSRTDIEAIFASSSNQLASGFVGTAGVAKGNSLENALDALGKLFVLNYTPTQSGRQTGDFGSLTFRNPFYEHLAAVTTTLAGATFSMEPLIQVDGQGQVVPRLTAAELKLAAQDPGDSGLAYRYALRALNPFAIIGVDYAGLGHAANGVLALADPATGFGEMTDQYLTDRAAFLLAKLDLTLNNQKYPSDLLAVTHYQDIASGFDVPASLLAIQREYLFGSTDPDALSGHDLTNDHLYGSSGNDLLRGFGSDDYLQGDSGDDWLDGATSNRNALHVAGMVTVEGPSSRLRSGSHAIRRTEDFPV
jgi:hypothetical protein